MKQKHSIRLKFTLIFVGIMALVLIGMYQINKRFLEKFYMNEMVETLKSAYTSVDGLINDLAAKGESLSEVLESEFGQPVTDSSVVSVFRGLNDNSNINVVMIGPDNTTILTTSREGEWLIKKLNYYMAYREEFENGTIPDVDIFGHQITRNYDVSFAPRIVFHNENYLIQQSLDVRSKTGYLECWGCFTDGETQFLMSMPVSLIQDSVKITNRFLLIVGSLLLFLGSILVYAAADAMTKPIERLARISKQMAGLDFTARYTGKRKDEIGVLGDAMNDMSAQLEQTIAELKTANNQLQKDIDEKTKIDEMRKDFIANVSHELKTPIALIQGYAEGLCEGLAEDKESRDYYCGVISDEAGKMNKLVKQLTSLNNLELGNDKVEFAYFDAGALIGSILEAQKLVIEEKKAQVSRTGPEHFFVWADEFKIEEVITNYFNNAINHLDGDRRIVVSAKPITEEKRIEIGVYNDGDPIPEEDIPHIWEKFFKVDKARTRAYGGSGIGLSIVKAIADSHGQQCGVENREKGVYFWFTLDASDGGSDGNTDAE